MQPLRSENDYHGTYNLDQLRPNKLILAGKAVGLEFEPYKVTANDMRLKILATGLPVPKELWHNEPLLPSDQPREIHMIEPKAEAPKVQEVDESAERDAFIHEMEETKSFFKVRGMAKAAGAEVGKSDTKADLIEKVRAL